MADAVVRLIFLFPQIISLKKLVVFNLAAIMKFEHFRKQETRQSEIINNVMVNSPRGLNVSVFWGGLSFTLKLFTSFRSWQFSMPLCYFCFVIIKIKLKKIKSESGIQNTHDILLREPMMQSLPEQQTNNTLLLSIKQKSYK